MAGETKTMSDVQVWIDPDLCTGDGSCYGNRDAEVFVEIGDGIAAVRGADGENVMDLGGAVRVPAAALDAVIEEADNCPGLCIFIEPLGTGPVESGVENPVG